MNTRYLQILLQDAAGNLRSLLDEIAENPDFSDIELSIHLNDVYGSLNTAWNGRELTEKEAADISEAQYYRLRSFPIQEIIMDGT